MSLADPLPAWSDASTSAQDYAALAPAAAALAHLDNHQREADLRTYSDDYCFPHLDLPKASGLYLLLRLLFALPRDCPRERAKVFGGWLHPSIDDGRPSFDLSWPVRVPSSIEFEVVGPFPGYFGKGYDAIGEYTWFRCTFEMRDADVLSNLNFAGLGPA